MSRVTLIAGLLLSIVVHAILLRRPAVPAAPAPTSAPPDVVPVVETALARVEPIPSAEPARPAPSPVPEAPAPLAPLVDAVEIESTAPRDALAVPTPEPAPAAAPTPDPPPAERADPDPAPPEVPEPPEVPDAGTSSARTAPPADPDSTPVPAPVTHERPWPDDPAPNVAAREPSTADPRATAPPPSTEGRRRPVLRIDWGGAAQARAILDVGAMRMVVLGAGRDGPIIVGEIVGDDGPWRRRAFQPAAGSTRYSNRLRIVDDVPAFAPVRREAALAPGEHLAVLVPVAIERRFAAAQLEAAFARGLTMQQIASFGGRFAVDDDALRFEITQVGEHHR